MCHCYENSHPIPSYRRKPVSSPDALESSLCWSNGQPYFHTLVRPAPGHSDSERSEESKNLALNLGTMHQATTLDSSLRFAPFGMTYGGIAQGLS